MRHIAAAIALLALSTTLVAAQPAAAPAIHRTALDVETGVLTITGIGLGADVVVLVDGRPAVILPGATDTEIRVVAPEPMLATAGAFRVVVGDPGRRLADGFVVLNPGGRLATEPAASQQAMERGAVVPGAEAGVARPLGAGRDASATFSVGIGPKLIENSANTAVGLGALVSTTTGYYNAALGYNALNHDTSGIHNTASGAWALYSNVSGNYNTATGEDALWSNTNGNYNTATGKSALYSVGGANFNTGTGYQALYGNTFGYGNTAMGANALLSNTFGGYNAAVGLESMYSNLSGQTNTAIGWASLYANTTGGSNTAAGTTALRFATGTANTAVGGRAGYALTTGSYNVYLGADVVGTPNDANIMRLGLPYDGATGRGQNQTFIAGIYGTQLTSPAQQVFVDVNGQLGIVGPQVVTGGGTTTPSAYPHDVQTLVAELRAQRAAMAAQQATIDALQRRVTALEGAAAASTAARPATGRR